MHRAKLLLVLLCLVSSLELHFRVTNIKDGGLLYSSDTGLNLQLFPPRHKNALCKQQQQYYTDELQRFQVESNLPITVSVRTDIRNVVANGLSRSIPIGERQYAELVILTRCVHEQITTFSYHLVLSIKWEEGETLVELPASTECLTDISSAKIEFVVLQFVATALFVVLSLIWTKSRMPSYDIDRLLVGMLCISPFHEYLAMAFSYILTVRFLYTLCAYCIAPPVRPLILAMVAAAFLQTVIIIAEVELPLLHVFHNFLTLMGLVMIFKVSRLRVLVWLWLLIYYAYPLFESMTRQYSDFQMYFPAIFTNRVYSCVSVNILQLAFPISFSLFFTRFSKENSQARNIYLMMHFMIYLSVGTYYSISQMKGRPLQHPMFISLLGIVGVSFLVALLQGNFRRLTQYRILV